MSFSSAQWTIPELCVWIVTRSRSAVNGLSSSVRQSLKYSDMIHGGAYAARDEVIEAAQQGKIIITRAGEANRYRSNPDRISLSRDFWNNAELEDAGHWQAPGSYWCVARRIDRPNTAREFRDLLVSRDETLKEWPQPASATASYSDPETQFRTWAETEYKAVGSVTENRAKAELARILRKVVGRNEARRWLSALPEEWRAQRGTPPTKISPSQR